MRSILPLTICLTAHVAVGAESVRIFYDGFFERQLSAYNLFADATAQIPNDGLVPYDLNTPLFTDYAHKHRFIYLPPGTKAIYSDYEPFAFPVGAAMVKTFSYPHDFRAPEKGRRLVETRLMIHTEDGWKGAAYLWNEDHTDATLKIAGATVPLQWTHSDGSTKSTKYLVPNMNQCKACHRGASGVSGPIGIKARHLNRRYIYASGTQNQLDYWREMGLLSGAPVADHAPKLTPWDDPDGSLEQRVLGYLDINCAHCHNGAGLASYTSLDLSYRQDDPHDRGIMKRPTAAGNSSRGRRFAIVPGNPDASFLLSRLTATEPHIRMPQIGRTMVHEEGVALLAEWIRSLKPE